MKMLDTIMEGTSMSKWEMNNLLGGDNINSADYCICTGGTTADNLNEFKSCKCSTKMTAYTAVSEISILSEAPKLSERVAYLPVF
ncbi:MAG: hypothetical protein LBO74_15175 [Candidatus Symbiothrix sp.]|nr:hypothetical protein [Candidatus Symbiothrix sp.]